MSEGKLVTPRSEARRLAAQTIRQLREAAGLTQESCALKYGLGLRTLRDIEAGKCRMTALELEKELQLAVASSSQLEARHAQLTLVRSDRVALSGPILFDCGGGRHETATASFFCSAPQKRLALQPATARVCTETSSDVCQCVQSWGVTPQGEAAQAVARRAA